MNQLESKFREFTDLNKLLSLGQSVLLAISGGIDSMVMLHLFSKLREEMKLQLSVVHINHQLRGEESIEDEIFVRNAVSAYGFPYYSECVDVKSYMTRNKLSKQVSARYLRYECFERIRQQINADMVATAHHANDNAETVLFNILRGTGLHGLSGIPLKRKSGNIVRPLLFAERTQIDEYAVEYGIKHRNDSSNYSLEYYRNYLRRKIIPLLQKRTPDIIGKLNAVADMMRDVNQKLQLIVDEELHSLVRLDSDGNMVMGVKKFKAEPDFLQDEILLELLNRLKVEPDAKKIGALRKFCSLSTGKELKLNRTCSAFKDRDSIIFLNSGKKQLNIQHVKLGESYGYKECRIIISRPEPLPITYSKTPDVEYVDAGLLSEHLILRPWQDGDWFIPLGMKKKKKLSDFFADQKVPRYLKNSVPILESDGNIVWICGRRLDDRFKLTDRSQSAIRLTYQPIA